ncbi:MAG: decaprenyl-phosphate phosphoribosyltransferase [candidate division Zixibacteria bacterium]|nr:decaprenyl-phosphate phosphoribosyltransferase [candidate division Zixibacteria bacterium]
MLKNIFYLIRPPQWIKNGVVLAGLIFAGKASDLSLLQAALEATIAFCFLSSAVYVFNDIFDRDRDRQHPLKKDRPLAAGVVSIGMASSLSILFAIIGLLISFSINRNLLLVSACYLGLNLLYTVLLKNIVIIDVMTIAAGFVLRALAGAVAIEVEFSGWLLITTFVLALFLALGKRRHELIFLQDEAGAHRKILEKYSPYLLDQLIGVVTASTVITYLFYTLSSDVRAKLHTQYLYLTIPFVIYGIFRYLYLVHKEEQGGSPTTLLLTDRPLLLDVLLWLASVVIILYIH